ncbi:bicaudal D-related protein-like protein, partial [Dinothrombium tinctorium]
CAITKTKRTNFSQQILEQEKHGLRRKLETVSGEYESRIAELQTDLSSLRKELDEKQLQLRQIEKDKANLIRELMEQNHRLTNELKRASESEDQLTDQLQSLREQFNARRSNLHDHVAQLEGLREEINILAKRKSDLEKRIAVLKEEREHLSMSLEESSDRILMLERQTQEQECLIKMLREDLDESRHANMQLENRLNSLQRKQTNFGSASFGSPSSNGYHTHTSLMNEIEMSSSSSNEEEMRSLNGHLANGSQIDEIECDLFGLNDSEFSGKLRQELVEIYQQLRRLCHDLQRRKDNNGSFNSTQDSGVPATPEEIQTSQIRVGMISAVVKELKLQLNDVLSEYYEGPCASCKSLLEERSELQKLRKEVCEKSDELKVKLEENNQLSTKVTILETELAAVKEERDNLKECTQTEGMGKDDIVKRAWELRDQAVARKNTVEIELAKTRIECMHVNSQLMEAIQQKIELSQQLEQWQVDMQNLLDEQLKKKLKSHEQQISANNVNVNNHRSSKLLKLWRS